MLRMRSVSRHAALRGALSSAHPRCNRAFEDMHVSLESVTAATKLRAGDSGMHSHFGSVHINSISRLAAQQSPPESLGAASLTGTSPVKGPSSLMCDGVFYHLSSSNSAATETRCMSTWPAAALAAADASTAAPAMEGNRVACPPGSTVVVDLRRSGRPVRLAVNEDPSQLMHLSWPVTEPAAAAPKTLLEALPRAKPREGELVHVQQPVPERLVVSSAGAGPPLVLHMPPRYCNAEVYSGGGDVHVAAIKEGTLSVESGGGSIQVDSVAGTFAELQSLGGDITGRITAGKVYLNTDAHNATGSGSVRLEKLLSKEAVILTRDLDDDPIPAVVAHSHAQWGDVQITALYSDEAHIRTGGMNVQISTLSCSRDGSILTDGGAVEIGCLDGVMRVISGGGAVGCALQKNVAAVHVNSMPKFDETDPVSVSAAADGGQIDCAVDPEVQALVAFQCGDLNVDESLPFEVLEVGKHLVKGRLGPLSEAVTAAAAAARETSATSESSVSRSAGAADSTPSCAEAPGPVSLSTNCGGREAAHPMEHMQTADAEAMPTTSDALAAKAAAAADPASLKHIVLDAGDKGAVKLTARSWMDGVRRKLDTPKQQGRKV